MDQDYNFNTLKGLIEEDTFDDSNRPFAFHYYLGYGLYLADGISSSQKEELRELLNKRRK